MKIQNLPPKLQQDHPANMESATFKNFGQYFMNAGVSAAPVRYCDYTHSFFFIKI